MDKRRIINTIRTLRFHHDEMTQHELADRVGVTRQTIIASGQHTGNVVITMGAVAL